MIAPRIIMVVESAWQDPRNWELFYRTFVANSFRELNASKICFVDGRTDPLEREYRPSQAITTEWYETYADAFAAGPADEIRVVGIGPSNQYITPINLNQLPDLREVSTALVTGPDYFRPDIQDLSSFIREQDFAVQIPSANGYDFWQVTALTIMLWERWR
jgi:hypothetical protein